MRTIICLSVILLTTFHVEAQNQFSHHLKIDVLNPLLETERMPNKGAQFSQNHRQKSDLRLTSSDSLELRRINRVLRKNHYYINEEKVERIEFQNHLASSETILYYKFRKGRRIKKAGKILTGISAARLGITITLLATETNLDFFSEYDDSTRNLYITGTILNGVVLGTGLALIFRGESMIKTSIKLHNNKVDNTGFYFNINENGIGLSYSF